jgi:hypothetical protein
MEQTEKSLGVYRVGEEEEVAAATVGSQEWKAISIPSCFLDLTETMRKGATLLSPRLIIDPKPISLIGGRPAKRTLRPSIGEV